MKLQDRNRKAERAADTRWKAIFQREGYVTNEQKVTMYDIARRELERMKQREAHWQQLVASGQARAVRTYDAKTKCWNVKYEKL